MDAILDNISDVFTASMRNVMGNTPHVSLSDNKDDNSDCFNTLFPCMLSYNQHFFNVIVKGDSVQSCSEQGTCQSCSHSGSKQHNLEV